MAYEESLKSISLDADASLAAQTGISGTPGAANPHYGPALFRFVKVTGAHRCGRAAAQTDDVIGVCQNKPQVVGGATTVAFSGVTMMMAGAAVAAADKISSDNQGRGVPLGGAGAGALQYGVAVDAAAAAGHLFPMLIKV